MDGLVKYIKKSFEYKLANTMNQMAIRNINRMMDKSIKDIEEMFEFENMDIGLCEEDLPEDMTEEDKKKAGNIRNYDLYDPDSKIVLAVM